jgi:hypothetical protein
LEEQESDIKITLTLFLSKIGYDSVDCVPITEDNVLVAICYWP